MRGGLSWVDIPGRIPRGHAPRPPVDRRRVVVGPQLPTLGRPDRASRRRRSRGVVLNQPLEATSRRPRRPSPPLVLPGEPIFRGGPVQPEAAVVLADFEDPTGQACWRSIRSGSSRGERRGRSGAPTCARLRRLRGLGRGQLERNGRDRGSPHPPSRRRLHRGPGACGGGRGSSRPVVPSAGDDAIGPDAELGGPGLGLRARERPRTPAAPRPG